MYLHIKYGKYTMSLVRFVIPFFYLPRTGSLVNHGVAGVCAKRYYIHELNNFFYPF